MVIDHGKLIALLVQKTGRDREQVEKQLSRLKTRLREVKETGEAFEIEGFGTFTASDGAIDFEPFEQLSTEINQKYAGMKPIELIEAFKETGAGVPVEEPPERSSEPEPAAEPERAEQEEKFPPKEFEETEEPVQEQQDESPPVIASESEQEEPDQPAIAEESEETHAADEADTEQEAERDESEITEETEEPPKKRKKVTAAYGNDRSDGNNIGTYLIAAVIVLGLIAGGWVLYESGFFAPSDTQESGEIVAADTTDRNASKTGRNDTARAAGPATDAAEQNVPDSVSQENAAAREFESGVYGLKGEATVEGQNGYTIVIHSFRLRSTVQEIADSLDQRGYRTVLFQGAPTVDSRWRLGLGQFETVESAQQAVPYLSEQYRNSHFIKRIQ